MEHLIEQLKFNRRMYILKYNDAALSKLDREVILGHYSFECLKFRKLVDAGMGF